MIVSELPAEDSDDEVDLHKFGRPKPPLTFAEKVAAFRKKDTGYQELLVRFDINMMILPLTMMI